MTVEEKAGMYAAKTEADFGFDMHPKTASFQGFIAGYAEAMRWRDPKETLPKTDESVIVKYRTAKNVEKHGIGKYFNIGIGNPWTIEGSTSRKVIGWRPIENKNHFEGRIEEAGCDFCRDEQGYTIGNMYVCDKCGRQVP